MPGRRPGCWRTPWAVPSRPGDRAGAVAATWRRLAVAASVVLLGRVVSAHRTSTAGHGRLVGGWLGCAVLGVSASARSRSRRRARRTGRGARGAAARGDSRDEDTFSAALARDPAPGRCRRRANRSAGQGRDRRLRRELRQGGARRTPRSRPGHAELRAGTAGLRSAGFSARSGYLTSPTFGGLSWLAHSTLQTGLRVDTQQRYDRVIAGPDHAHAGFRAAGWRTVCDIPANHEDWGPARTFYHCDATYDARSSAYAGPPFGYATVPDQYTLAELARRSWHAPSRHRSWPRSTSCRAMRPGPPPPHRRLGPAG